MKTVFDILHDVSYAKPDYKLQASDDFNIFMLCRWISFVSPQFSYIINEIYNTKHKTFTDDQAIYDSLKLFLPKIKFGKINFMKKTPKDKTKSNNEDLILMMCDSLELSRREVVDILETEPELVNFFKDEEKALKVYKVRSK